MPDVKKLGLPQGPLYLMTEVVRHRERRISRLLRDLGLSLHEWRTLRILYSYTEDVPLSTIIEHSQTDRTALGRSVDRLVSRGWVTRLPHPDDKRALYLHVEETSLGVFEKAHQAISALDEELLSVLSKQDLHNLEQQLLQIEKVAQR